MKAQSRFEILLPLDAVDGKVCIWDYKLSVEVGEWINGVRETRFDIGKAIEIRDEMIERTAAKEKR